MASKARVNKKSGFINCLGERVHEWWYKRLPTGKTDSIAIMTDRTTCDLKNNIADNYVFNLVTKPAPQS